MQLLSVVLALRPTSAYRNLDYVEVYIAGSSQILYLECLYSTDLHSLR